MADYLYIHIPFCIKKCLYCDFYSIPFESSITEDYINAVCKEIKLRKESANSLKTVYIGGGTPTILSENGIQNILNAVKENCFINPDAEITIEANPGTISAHKAEKLLKAGINRISIGIQSLVDEELVALGRSHTATDAINALKDARQTGCRNISADLIYGIPGQSLAAWELTILKIIELAPEHISTYELTPEENTPLHEYIKSGRIMLPDEDVISEMYYKGIDILKTHGYIHYEISNFAKPGYECIHNLNCWNRGEYLGIGAGAHSFSNGKRTANLKDVFSYIKNVNKGKLPIAEEIEITKDEAAKELIFLGLRKTDGIDTSLIPVEKRELIKKAAEELHDHGLVEIKNNHLRLTRKGLILSNEVIVKVLLHIDTNRP